ncbi:hypothetical protein D3273_03060 [Lichenibacterium minor]|uniref:Uncharacterized protein n=1 Tax=Lichenibacterium minor TaxID=2316528 RepID=A0A4Q2UED8_9HYPH|nr:hypothetical protein [Lichenibacterium minor]RYC33466.1 hypothetical protein D3273_03060 [Lichenibacterium minor]
MTRNGVAQQPCGLVGLLNALNPVGTAQAAEEPPGRLLRREGEPAEPAELEPGEVMRVQRFNAAREALEKINPRSRAFQFLEKPGALPSEAEIAQLEAAVRDEYIKRTCDFLRPDGKPIGEQGTSSKIRVLPGGLIAAQRDYDYLSSGGASIPLRNGSMTQLPGGAGTITLRPVTSTPGSPAIDINVPGVIQRKLHYFGDE